MTVAHTTKKVTEKSLKPVRMMDFNLLFYFLSKFCEYQNNSETHLRPLKPNKLKSWEREREQMRPGKHI